VPASVAALLLLLVLPLQGAASPDRLRKLTAVLDTGAMSSSVLTPDALYLARPDGRIEANPLTPGAPRWSAQVQAASPSVTLAGSVLIVRPGTFFLDARTGRELWRTPDPSVVHVLGDRVAYLDSDGLLRMADLATGRVRWQRQTSERALDGDPGHRYVLGIDDEERATLYSAVDGTVLAAGRGVGVDPYDSGLEMAVGRTTDEFVGEVLYTHGQTSVAAYRLTDLAPMWRTPVVEPSLLGACGNLICTTGNRGATAIDPATGAVRWTSPRWRSIAPDGLAVAADLRVARIDPATGRVRHELGRGNLVGDLLLRYDRDRTFVTALADSRVFGVVPVTALAVCATAGNHLACRTGDRSVIVWRVTAGRVRAGRVTAGRLRAGRLRAGRSRQGGSRQGGSGDDRDGDRGDDRQRDDRGADQDDPGHGMAEVQRHPAAVLGHEDPAVARVAVERHQNSVGRCRSRTGITSATGTGRPSSALSDVTPASRIPQGTKRSYADRSQSQLSANPCWVTARATRMPIAAILRSGPRSSARTQAPLRPSTRSVATPNSAHTSISSCSVRRT
jgi:hypothetical protein